MIMFMPQKATFRHPYDEKSGLGVRYQPLTRPTEVNGLNDLPYRCDCNNVAPRFGFAYRFNDNWGAGSTHGEPWL